MAMNIDLKNINMSDIKDQITKLLANKKLVTKIGVIFGAVVLFLIIYYAVLNPMVNSRKAKLDDMNKKKLETVQFVNDVKKMKARIKTLRPEYEKYSSLFHSKAEVEGLYNSLSRFAAANGLVISKITKQDPIPVLKEGQTVSQGLIEKNMVSYYKIPVLYEIKGKFLGFIKFKRAVSKSNKMLNFDKESVSVVQGDTTGTIVAQGQLTIVGLPDEFF